MDFNQAIQAHVSWKTKLIAYIHNPDHSLDAATVAGDANCILGKRLNGEGQKFSGTAEFSALVAEHARFHKAAAEIIRRADRGEKVDSGAALGGDSDFSKMSSSVVSALVKMKAKAA